MVFKKGGIPWNKGKKTGMIPWNKGKIGMYSKESLIKMKVAQNRPDIKERHSKSKLNEKNPMWKGDSVGLNALHKWIRKRLPKPNKCQICFSTSIYDLANISGRYLRDLSDWHWICRRCHMLSDGRMKNLKQYQEVVRNQQW